MAAKRDFQTIDGEAIDEKNKDSQANKAKRFKENDELASELSIGDNRYKHWNGSAFLYNFQQRFPSIYEPQMQLTSSFSEKGELTTAPSFFDPNLPKATLNISYGISPQKISRCSYEPRAGYSISHLNSTNSVLPAFTPLISSLNPLPQGHQMQIPCIIPSFSDKPSVDLKETKLISWQGKGKKMVLVDILTEEKINFPLNYEKELKGIYHGTPIIRNDILYLCGWGLNSPCDKFVSLKTKEENKNGPEKLAKIRNSRMYYGFICYEDFLYMIGGSNNNICCNHCQKYSIKENKWYNIPPLIAANIRTSVCIYNKEILYSIGCFPLNNNIQKLNLLIELEGWELIKINNMEIDPSGYICEQISNKELIIFCKLCYTHYLNIEDNSNKKIDDNTQTRYELLKTESIICKGEYKITDEYANIYRYDIINRKWKCKQHCLK